MWTKGKEKGDCDHQNDARYIGRIKPGNPLDKEYRVVLKLISGTLEGIGNDETGDNEKHLDSKPTVLSG
jgi:hypothetical protein